MLRALAQLPRTVGDIFAHERIPSLRHLHRLERQLWLSGSRQHKAGETRKATRRLQQAFAQFFHASYYITNPQAMAVGERGERQAMD
jgi:hypothetical protein